MGRGVRLAGSVQTVLAVTLTMGLLTAGIVALTQGAGEVRIQVPQTGADLSLLLATVGLVFFAFTGWEMISFTTEEYRNPPRDFPRVLAISFVLVTAMYLLLAAGLQAQVSPDDPTLTGAPMRGMVEGAVGDAGALLVSVLGVVVIAANLVGAIWGASRLVMSSAREGLLPTPLAVVEERRSSPRRAVVAVTAVFILVVAASSSGLLSLTTLLGFAGRNFFWLYLLSVVVYVRLFPGAARAFGVIVAVVLGAVTLSFGLASWLYVGALFVTGVLLERKRRVSPGRTTTALQMTPFS